MNIKKGVLLLVALLGLSSRLTLAAEPLRCVSAWYPSSDAEGGLEALLANADILDAVNPFWYTPLPDGQLQALPTAENTAELAAWRAADLQIIPAIFTNLPQPIMEEETRTQHIAAIVELVLRMDYDGIDIDYEGFPLNSREAFSSFIETLATALHEHDKRLTIAVHAKTTDTGMWEGAAAQDWTRLAAAVDEFRIMTYDYTNRNEPPGAIAPLDWVLDVITYAATVTDLSKVRLGLPFYGYLWKRGKPPATTIAWSNMQHWVNSFQLDAVRTDDDIEAIYDFKVTGLPQQTVYMSDGAGLAAKLAAVKAEFPALGGYAIWGVGGEDPQNWAVLRAAGCAE